MNEPQLRDLFIASHLGDVSDIVPMTGGLSGAATYAVTASSGEYVLKLQDRDRAIFHRVTTMQRLAASAGITPPLVFVDEACGASISAKIEGVPLAAALGDPDIAFPDVRSLVIEIWRSQTARPGFPSWAMELGKRCMRTRSSASASEAARSRA